MDSLTDTCFLCLRNNIKVQSVLFQDTDGIVVNEKLRSFFPEIIDSTPDEHKLSCSLCLEKLRISYDFKQAVIHNHTMFRDYIKKLQCQHKSHQQLARSKHQTITSVTKDDTAKKVEKCSENIEIEEIFIKEEPPVDDFSSNYLDEESMESEDNIYECQICHLGFNSSINLEFHTSYCNKKTQEPERIATKKIGNDLLSNPNNNTNSTSSNNGFNDERPNKKLRKRRYKCSECPKAFTAPSHLKAHTRIHTGERPFKCQICKKTFTMAHNLDRHTLTHTGEKPHDCDICQKSFNQKSILLTHKRLHGNVRPYQCSICKKTFTQNGHLTTHMNLHFR